MADVPITPGTGAASVAAETVSGISYQKIEVYGGGGASVLSVNPDGSFKASIIGTPAVSLSGSPSISGAITVVGTPSISGSVNVPNTVSVAGAVQMAGSSPSSIVTVTRLDNQIIGSMLGMVGQIVIHGLTTGGGGGYVDVKVDPSGALVTSIPSVLAFQGGTSATSILSSNPSSVLVGASIFGQLPAGTATIGSVATLQGTTPWIISSVYGNISGSVVGFQGGSWSTSIAGGFANLYAPSASFVSGVTSVITSTGLTSVLQAAGGSIKNYVTHILVTNGAATGAFVDVVDGGGNVLYKGYAAASGGGFSATLPVPLIGSANKSVDVRSSAQASIIAAMTGYTA